MIETEIRTATFTKEEESVIEAQCDCCKKQLPIEEKTYYRYKIDSKTVGDHVSLVSSHGDWCVDSGDSVERFQFCSMKCCLDWMVQNKEDLRSHTRSFEIDCHGTY